jgi:hypothetical protein
MCVTHVRNERVEFLVAEQYSSFILVWCSRALFFFFGGTSGMLTQRRSVVPDVSGQSVSSKFRGQAILHDQTDFFFSVRFFCFPLFNPFRP